MVLESCIISIKTVIACTKNTLSEKIVRSIYAASVISHTAFCAPICFKKIRVCTTPAKLQIVLHEVQINSTINYL